MNEPNAHRRETAPRREPVTVPVTVPTRTPAPAPAPQPVRRPQPASPQPSKPEPTRRGLVSRISCCLPAAVLFAAPSVC
jgi:hypothetical protein